MFIAAIAFVLGLSSALASEFKFVVPVEVGQPSRGAILIEAPNRGKPLPQLRRPASTTPSKASQTPNPKKTAFPKAAKSN